MSRDEFNALAARGYRWRNEIDFDQPPVMWDRRYAVPDDVVRVWYEPIEDEL